MEVVLSHKVDDHVDSLSTCRFQYLLRPVLCVVVEASGSSEAFAEIDLLLRTGGDVDCRGVVSFGKLNARDGNGGGAGVPQDGLARAEASDKVHGLRRCDPRLCQATSAPSLLGPDRA